MELVKYDDNLQECWNLKAKGGFPHVKFSRHLLNVKITIIYKFITQKTRGRRFDGEVFCLNKNDGTLVWKRKFDCQIDDCQLLDENRVVLYTGNELQILDVTTGDTQKTITTDFIIDNSAKFIFIADGYLLLCNEKETCINVYQISDFECVKHLVLPTDTRFKYEPVALDGKVYLSGGIPALGEGMFVIDLYDLDTPLQLEQEPELNITLPTKDDGKVLIEVSDIAIDELVRFGEWVIYRQMVDNGINIHRNGYKENKLFNGQVLLKCHNLICDADLKETYKTTMIERMKIIADSVGVSGLRCGKGENSVSLQIEFD
jgi:hypothetical protein